MDTGSTKHAFPYKAAYPLVVYISITHKNQSFDTHSTSEKEIQ